MTVKGISENKAEKISAEAAKLVPWVSPLPVNSIRVVLN